MTNLQTFRNNNALHCRMRYAGPDEWKRKRRDEVWRQSGSALRSKALQAACLRNRFPRLHRDSPCKMNQYVEVRNKAVHRFRVEKCGAVCENYVEFVLGGQVASEVPANLTACSCNSDFHWVYFGVGVDAIIHIEIQRNKLDKTFK